MSFERGLINNLGPLDVGCGVACVFVAWDAPYLIPGILQFRENYGVYNNITEVFPIPRVPK